MTIVEFIHSAGLTMTAEWADRNPNMTDDAEWSRQASHWKCTLRLTRDKRRQMTTYFSMGAAHKSEPKLSAVLDCMASDAVGFENAGSFEDWASEYGYDTDSRKAEKTYRTIEKQARTLRQLLGDEHYKALLWNTDRE